MNRSLKLFFFIPILLGFGPGPTSFPDKNIQTAKDKFIVVLDAGHGGHDPGNLGNGYLEKNIALNIVLQAGKILEQQADVEVIYTRKDDTFVDLYVRGEIANRAKADLFVSVHCDSHSSDAHGAGTFVLGLHANKQNFEIAKKENSVIYLEDNYETRYAEYDINSPESVIGLTIMQEEFLDQSILLAKLMQDNFSKNLKRNNRKVKQAGFIVLHQTFMPSVLVETGFLTNKSEGNYLNSKKGQLEMGKAIASAIQNYKQSINSNFDELTDSTGVITPPPTVATKEKEADLPAEKSSVTTDKEPRKELTTVTAKELKTAQEVDPEVSKAKEIIKTEEEVSKPTISKEEPKETVPPPLTPKEDKTVTKPQADKNEATKEEMPKANIVFKVQLMASSRDLPLRSEDFKGLNTLSKEPFKNLFRYMYGNTNSYQQVKLFKSNADAKGYTSSYIVAYKDGIRIPLQEALKYVSE